jgi:hypothetical protein
MNNKPVGHTFPIVEQLPAEYLQGIGLIMTTWARLEYDLRDLTFFVLNIDHKRGRTAIRTPRAKEMLEMIDELLWLDGIKVKSVDMSKFQVMVDETESRRNILAHNIWFLTQDGKYVVQNMQGSWPKENGKKIKKRVQPEGKSTTTADLTHVVDRILEAIRAARIVRQEIAPQLLALRQTPQQLPRA